MLTIQTFSVFHSFFWGKRNQRFKNSKKYLQNCSFILLLECYGCTADGLQTVWAVLGMYLDSVVILGLSQGMCLFYPHSCGNVGCTSYHLVPLLPGSSCLLSPIHTSTVGWLLRLMVNSSIIHTVQLGLGLPSRSNIVYI